MWSLLAPSVDFLVYSLSKPILRSTYFMNFQFAPPDKVVLKDDN